MKNTFHGMFGIEIMGEVIIEGHNAMPDQKEEIVQDGLQRVKELADNLVK